MGFPFDAGGSIGLTMSVGRGGIGLKPTRIIANLVGMMLFVQVILGGGSVLLQWPVIYHIVWGGVTFVVLIAATLLAARDYSRQSSIFRVGIAAIADYIIQIVLGYIALNSDVTVVIHLTNAFLLSVFTTYLISFADSAEKTGAVISRAATAGSPLGSL
jgi:heme A synthase